MVYSCCMTTSRAGGLPANSRGAGGSSTIDEESSSGWTAS